MVGTNGMVSSALLYLLAHTKCFGGGESWKVKQRQEIPFYHETC